MNKFVNQKHARPIHGVVAFAFLAIGFVGPVSAGDVRLSHDSYSGITIKNSTRYLACVDGSVGSNEQVFIYREGDRTQLLTGNADPLKASGILEIMENDGIIHLSAHQRDAGHDKGALLNAAQICATS